MDGLSLRSQSVQEPDGVYSSAEAPRRPPLWMQRQPGGS